RIEIDDTNKVSAKGLDVVDTDQQTGADLSLDTDGGLIRAWERLVGLRDVGVGRLIGRRPTAVRIRVAGVGDLYGALVAQEPGEQRVVEEHAVVEDPEAPSDRCLPRAERIPCEAETRRDIELVEIETGHAPTVVTNADIQGDVVRQTPRVLREQGDAGR